MKHSRTLVQWDMKRRYTGFSSIFQKQRTFVIRFSLRRSLFLQLKTTQVEQYIKADWFPCYPGSTHCIVWCIKDCMKDIKMEELLYHIVSPDYWMKVYKPYIQ